MTDDAMADLPEGQHVERKSLRKVTGKTADFMELAHDCVCLANGSGGVLLIGIEDGETRPPAGQRIDPPLLDRVRRRVSELTVNVQVLPEVRRNENGGEVLVLSIPRSSGVASTTDGRYFLRVGDTCRPVVGDDVLRLANERPSMPWELQTSANVVRPEASRASVSRLTAALRASDRVKPSVKEKSDDELLDHYGLATGGVLTNLGVLLVGTPEERARLGTAPIIQAIRYDERGTKVGKFTWDDHALSPVDLIDAVWKAVPDFRESYEFPVGMLKEPVPAFEEVVVRELLVNALVHRPYTQGGDIFLNLHPDRLEVVNPGRLPIGVTPRNILHSSRRRNDGLARVFHDLKLMEREGSGIDLVWERLLVSGRPAPMVGEGVDSVHVTVPRRVLAPGVLGLLLEADRAYQLTQRERIAVALLAQSEGLGAADLASRLELEGPGALRSWIGRPLELGLVELTGRTAAARYTVRGDLLRSAGLDRRTTLKLIQPHRLRALLMEDLERYPDSARGEIHRRIGREINERTITRVLGQLVEEGLLAARGERRWRTYRIRMPRGQRQ